MMSNDQILLLNENGEEIPSHVKEDAFSAHSQRKEKNNKKGFRIDDILFSVANNTVRKTACYSMQSTTSPSCSSSSSNVSSLDDIPILSPVSFVQETHSTTGSSFDMLDKRSESSPSPKLQSLMKNQRSRSMSPSQMSYQRLSSDPFSSSSNDVKKPRTSFSPHQIQALEDSFQEKRYLNHNERMILAEELNLTDCQIKTWFQNRRMKMKRQYKEAVDKGYLIPYHPYPFPRYSRLTPAHFASLPALNARRFLGKKSRSYSGSSNGTGCHCCLPTTTSPCSYGHSRDSRESYPRSIPTYTQANCSEYHPYSRRGPDVLPRRRSVERRDTNIQYDNEFSDYFHSLPTNKSTLEDTSKKFTIKSII